MTTIEFCEICGEPLYTTNHGEVESHECFPPGNSYEGPIGENKTFSDKMEDNRLMRGEMDD